MKSVAAVRPPTNDTESRLLDAALTLFAEKGYEATSVREIIEAAGVTRPVLYYYCSSKEDLYRRIVHWKHDQAYQDLERQLERTCSSAERLRAVMRGSFAFCVADPRVPRLMFQTHYGPAIPGVVEFMAEMTSRRFGLIQRVMSDGLLAGELAGGDSASLALVFCCLMDQHLNVLSRLSRPERRLTPGLADSLVDVFLFGVGTGRRSAATLPPFAGAP